MAVETLNTVFDLAAVFQQVYGYTPAHVAGLPTGGNGMPAATVPSTVKKITNIFGEPLYSQSDMIGREVFCPITIEVDGVDYPFPYSVIGFTRVKTIVETEMTELDGEVDEIISNRSWQISIKGFLIGQYDQFPDDGLQMLDTVSAYNQTVRLKSAMSDIFLHTNDNILIKKVDIPQKAKVIGVRDYAFEAKVSNIFTLYIS